MTMISSIPTLTDAVSAQESKTFNAFLISFFNIERARDNLKRLGYAVGRTIIEEGQIKVMYSFPNGDGTYVTLGFSRDNPYDGREVILNKMLQKIEQIRQEQRIASAKKAITTSLKPAEVDILKSLTPAELQELLSRIG